VVDGAGNFLRLPAIEPVADRHALVSQSRTDVPYADRAWGYGCRGF
jgi:hypothetical protein